MKKHISLINIAKQSAKFNFVNIINNILYVPKSIVIAMLLVPNDYGIISFLGLWSMYATLINPGLLSARSREMPHLLGSNNEKQAIRIQNTSHSSDLVYSLIPFVVILSASFFFSNRILKIGFILTALAYALNHFVDYWRGVNFVRQYFSLVAKADLIKSVSTIGITVVFIFWFKIYAVLVAPIIGAFLAGIYYWKKGKIGYQFLFDWPEAKRLFKIGIPFSMLALVFWGCRLVDKTIIACFLPLNELGIYSYATVFMFLGMTFLSDLGNILNPILWTKASEAENGTLVFYDTKRITVYLSILTAIMIPLSQLCFYLLVQLLTTKFIGSIPVFIVLSCNLYLTTLAIIPSLILQSSVVNKQVLSLKIYFVGLLLNIIFDLFAIRMGYGILGIALVTVAMQGLITITLFFFVRNYIFYKKEEIPAFILSIGIPLLLTIAFCFFHNYLMDRIVNPWLLGIISLSIQIVLWVNVIAIFYRKYFSRDKIDKVIKELMKLIVRFTSNIFKKLHLQVSA